MLTLLLELWKLTNANHLKAEECEVQRAILPRWCDFNRVQKKETLMMEDGKQT